VARILVIEDERDLQTVLEYNLRRAGHQVFSALRGHDGLRLAREHRPELVILDIMLPDLQGTEVCRGLKREPATRGIPVLMLTAKGEELDRVAGFELGADDYVVKPFSVRELLLRIEAILRRARGEQGAASTIEFGLLRLDPGAHRAWVAGNRVQNRSTLLDDVWGLESNVTVRTVDTRVKRLREKLGPAGAYIETVRGVGYRFVDSAEEANP
jgi:two-component system phosphate regulon response regulator PhoB